MFTLLQETCIDGDNLFDDYDDVDVHDDFYDGYDILVDNDDDEDGTKLIRSETTENLGSLVLIIYVFTLEATSKHYVVFRPFFCMIVCAYVRYRYVRSTCFVI